ncbi:DUF4142 domain-containing protein [Gluconacetobacter tumulisoli]|uniref:DUF4142 domain-containing protein n=1 Tax=Gluconacetobacter tumulisoli TaxID=1286189 RepID=A0A7W4K5Y9_9PROT|nr:DUF4142 domain-containing protein [Gluconacetobacter tumulisoli]MBB2200805.1 DUF4142 domain-containing protein [Gluconacetobacter tumulisoli]
MKRITILVAALCLSASAEAQSLPERTGMNSMTGTAPSTADFVKIATISDLFEIGSSELALQNQNQAITTFATRMVEDHKKTSAALKDLVSSSNLQAAQPTTMDESHQKLLDSLKKLHGDLFVRQYRKDQISGHEDAVSLFRRYAQGGENAALKNWATQTLPTLEDHLKMARSLPE